MNELMIAAGQPLTMSSREIADLCEKRHDNVKRTMETLRDKGVITFTQIEEKSEGGRPGVVYLVGKRDSYVVVAQLCPEFTARLVDRWQELEVQTSKPVDPIVALNDPVTMRGLLLTYSEKVLELEAANAELLPKAEALERIADADGTMCVTSAAKSLQMRPKDLFGWLQQNRWIYKRAGSSTWSGYQDRIQQGVLEHKVTTVSRSDGSEKVVEQVLVTSKGLARLAELIPIKPRLVA